MGRSWLPEHSARNQSPTVELSIPAMVFLPESDNEDQDVQIHSDILENDGYQLLTNHDPSEHLDTEENDEDTLEDEDSQPTSDNEGDAPEVVNNADEDKMINSVPITHPPRDIAVNFDQVRAAMAHVTLPVSSIPNWAAEVPDSEWGTFLQTRIKSLQQGNSYSK